jgi:hypothetical protein
MLVAAGGGALAFVAVILLNRLLVAIGFSIKKHPEAGSIVLTGAAIGVGVVGAIAGYLAAFGTCVNDKAKELAAAALGGLIVVYIIVAVGAALGVFRHVHFNTGRLATPGLVIAVIVLRTLRMLSQPWRQADGSDPPSNAGPSD